METKQITQKEIRPVNGILMLILITIGIVAAIALIILGAFFLNDGSTAAGVAMLVVGILGTIICPVLYAGLKVVGPNEALVLTLFGNYYGTILKQGFYYVNPFATYNNPAYMNALEKAKAAAASVETEKGRRGSSGSVKVNAKKDHFIERYNAE